VREVTAQKQKGRDDLRPALRGDFNVGGVGVRIGYFHSLQAHSFEVELNGFAHIALNFFPRATGGDTSRQVRGIGRIARVGFLDNNQVFFHFLSPACLRMLLSVPGASSSLRFPGTVTSPFFVGCRNC